MSKRILLLGKNGQVGWELQRALAPLGQLIMHDRNTCDLADTKTLAQTIDATAPDIIVNAAAYTAVDRAEADADNAYRINTEAVGVMANFAAKQNALLVHYSTDYVFDGTNNLPYVETDTVNPLSVYGKSKYQGEQAIIASGCAHYIFRTSWVFATRGANFAKTMLRLAGTQEKLRVVSDQWGAPTSAALIADVTAHALHRQHMAPPGIYHLAAGGETNWHEYAKFVIERAATKGAAIKTTHIEPIATSDYPTPAARPMNSRMNCARLESTFNLLLPHWQHHVEHMLTELTGQ
ncbi:MAG: dTDP-4-dehydrorhamnose reductase [Spongiibacteraceae bacterium]